MKLLTTTLCLTIFTLLATEVKGSDLPQCKNTIYKSETLLWDQCVGTWEYQSSDSNSTAIYKGEWKQGKRTGKGTLTIVPSSKFGREKYVGEFEDGKRTGQGTYNFANGDKYVGQFRDGTRNGQGTYTFKNGDRYVGEFKNNKKHGKGIYFFAGGKIYNGTFKNGKFIRNK